MTEITFSSPELSRLEEDWRDFTRGVDTGEPVVRPLVTGRGAVIEGSGVLRAEPQLEEMNLLAVFQDRPRRELRDGLQGKTGKLESLRDNRGYRDEEYYMEYLEVLSGGDDFELEASWYPVELDGLFESFQQVEEAEDALLERRDREGDVSVDQVSFGTGVANPLNEYSGVEEAYTRTEDLLGFELIFSYTGDPEASEDYREYMDRGLGITASEGVPQVLVVGRHEEPVLYRGQRGIEVDEPATRELLGEDIETATFHELLENKK